MLGRSARYILVTLLLVAPQAAASSPAPNLTTAFSTDGQTISDLAMDPTGEFVVAVVNVDAGKAVVLPGQPAHRDIYPCDFGAPNSVSTGTGCRGINNENTIDQTATHTGQSAAYTSYVQGGVVGRYAVAGPGNSVSVWADSQDSRLYRNVSTAPANQWAVNVTLAPDGSRVVAGFVSVPASSSTPGSGLIAVYDTIQRSSELTYDWGVQLDANPTGLAYSRLNNIVVAGTTKGLLFLRPLAAPPQNTAETNPVDTAAAVREVKITRTGDAAVAATERGVYFVLVNTTSGAPILPGYSRDLDPAFGASSVALSTDGSRFAASSGPTIHFYRNLNNTFVAEEVGTPFHTPDNARVSDIAYDGRGKLLVAVAGSRVYGFAPNSNQPVWSFDGTDVAKGSLDAPLSHVAVAEGAERIVVAGKSTLMPYRTVVAASATFDQPQGLQVQPSSTVPLTFRVTNTGSVADNYTFVTDVVPSGWNVRGPADVLLAPDETITLNVSVDIPSGAAPGLYGIRYQVRSHLLFDQGVSQTSLAGPGMNLTIPRAIVLNVTTAEDRLPPLRAGGDVSEPVTIRNVGNAAAVVNVTATQILSRGATWPVRFDRSHDINIPAGGDVTINMIVSAPSDAASGDRDDITILAREGRPGVDDVIAEATKLVTVYVDPKFGAELSARNSSFEFFPTDLKQIPVNILNTGNTDDTFNVTFLITPSTFQYDWRVTLDHDHLLVPRGAQRTVIVTVRPAVSNPREASLILKAASNGSGETQSSALTFSLVGKPPTTTPTRNPIPDVAPALIVGIVAMAAIARRRAPRLGGRK